MDSTGKSIIFMDFGQEAPITSSYPTELRVNFNKLDVGSKSTGKSFVEWNDEIHSSLEVRLANSVDEDFIALC